MDAVNHPAHYADKEIEVIDYIRDTLTQEEFVGYCIGNALKYLSRWRIRDTLTQEEFVGYCIGNALKYLSRWRKKGGVEDLEKAAVYLGWAIEREKGQENGAE